MSSRAGGRSRSYFSTRIFRNGGYFWLRVTGFFLAGLLTAHIMAEFVLRGMFRDVNNPVLNTGILIFVLTSLVHGLFGWQRVVDDIGISTRGRVVLIWLHIVVGAFLILAALIVLGRLGRL